MKSSHFAQMFELMSQGVWQLDAVGKTIFANSRMAAMVGYSPEEFLLLPSLSLVQEEDRNWIAARIASRRHGVRDEYECQLSHKDGSWVPVTVEAVPLQSDEGEFDGTLALVTDRREVVEALRKSEALLKGLTDAVPDPLFMKDREGRCLFANPATLKLLGKSLDQMIGRTDREIHNDPSVAEALTENERGVMESGKALEIEEIIRTPHGEHVLRTAKAPLFDHEGRVIGIVGCARDVTERKRVEDTLRERERALQQSESQTQMALKIGHAGSWHYDVKTDQIWGSAEGLRMFGYAPVAKYWPIEDIEACIPDRERVHQALVDLLTDGTPYDLQYVIHPADGSPPRDLYSVATVTKDADGNPIEVVGFVQDITDRKLAENDLRRLAAELTEANRLKDIFTDVLRHDIVNPAGAIQNATDVLLGQESNAVTAEVLQHIRHAATNLIEMTVLASKLATIATHDALTFATADAVQAMRTALVDLEHKLTAKNIALLDHSGPGFSANFHPLVKEVFANLVSNAIKYSPGGTRIEIAAEDRGESWVFFVKDQGVGVPDAHKHTIFHRFERVRRDGVRGTGLGLAIAEQIVNLHRGQIWVEDNPGGGSIFFVKLPKSP